MPYRHLLAVGGLQQPRVVVAQRQRGDLGVQVQHHVTVHVRHVVSQRALVVDEKLDASDRLPGTGTEGRDYDWSVGKLLVCMTL